MLYFFEVAKLDLFSKNQDFDKRNNSVKKTGHFTATGFTIF
jgi:hypothetical protein